MLRAVFLAAVLGLAAGCAGPFSPAEFDGAQRCQHTGGWWHPPGLYAGYCEYEAPGFL